MKIKILTLTLLFTAQGLYCAEAINTVTFTNDTNNRITISSDTMEQEKVLSLEQKKSGELLKGSNRFLVILNSPCGYAPDPQVIEIPQAGTQFTITYNTKDRQFEVTPQH